MMLILKKHVSFTPPLYSHPQITTTIRHLRLYSSSSSTSSPTQNQPPKSSPITDFLISECGFSPQKAAAISKPISTVTSLSNPNSVRHFLKHLDLTDVPIRSIISHHPRILTAQVNKTLQPNLHSLRTLFKLSDSDLQTLVVSNPRVLTNPRTVPRLKFWKKFLNGDTKKLILAVKKNQGLLNNDIDKCIAPKIALLESYGFSKPNIEMVLLRGCRVIRRRSDSLGKMLKKVEEFGFPRGSSMFVHGLVSFGSNKLDTFEDKVELLKSLGWSETEFLNAFQRSPGICLLSKENIRRKIEFLVGTVGCSKGYIVSHPTLLNFSFEKRLMPRLHVMKKLESSMSSTWKWDVCYIMQFTEKNFLKFLLGYKKVVPRLLETYVAACEGLTPDRKR